MSSREKKLLTLEDLLNMPPPQWLVQDFFETNTLVMVAGAPGSFKSFLALDWILCMVFGKHWNEKKVKQSKVLYVLGEGKSSLVKRMKAWCRHNNLADNAALQQIHRDFRVTFDVPQLGTPAALTELLQTMRAEGFVPDVVVLDTFARSFVGKDENSSKDTGEWIKAAEDLRSQGFTVIFLHHTRKNTEFGHQFRGSSAIHGAMDTCVTVVRDNPRADTVEVTITKQKDHDEGDPLFFRRVFVPDPSGKDGSIVLQLTEEPEDVSNTRALQEVLEGTGFTGVRDRAKALSEKLGITESAAKSRVERAMKRTGKSLANAPA